MNAYLVVDITTHDSEKFGEYLNKIPEFVEKHAGRYIVKDEEPTVIEGDWNPERMIVIEFPSSENAKTFLQDPDVKTLFSLRHEATTSKIVLVEGCLK